MIRPLSRALALVLVATPLVAVHAQATPLIRREVLRGRVTTDSGRVVVAGAEVTITMAPDRSFLRTRTDSSGFFEIVFEHGTGDYLVHVAAPGMETFRKRVTREGRDSTFALDVQLTSTAAQQMAAVNVRAQKPRMYPGADFRSDPAGPGAAERDAQGVAGAIPPELANSLAAIAMTVPGVTSTPGGASVAGVSPSQNSTTLNGLGFSGADIPRDVMAFKRVTTSTYEPARGWFGGLEQQIELYGDVVSPVRSAHLTLDTPALQYTDPTSNALGGRYARASASIGGADRMHQDRIAYNYGVSATHRTEDMVSVLGAPANILTQSGIAPDSAARLRDALAAAGLPAGTRPMGTRATDGLTVIGQIGNAQSSWIDFRKEVYRTWTLLAYGSTTRESAGALVPTATATTASTTRSSDAALQYHLSNRPKDNMLVEATTGVSASRRSMSPDMRLPAASVTLVSRNVDDVTATTIAPIAFGGASAMLGTFDRWTWETSGDAKLYPVAHPKHRLKLSADARVDGVRNTPTPSLGAFAFQSLGDVAANRPSSFTRVVNTPTQSAANANAFVALGDWWRAGDALDLLYGVRVEGTRFLAAPAGNPAVASAFGVRTDQVPNAFALSPRFGFRWNFRGEAHRWALLSQRMGVFPRFPSGTLRGGIGEFRSFLAPDLVAATRAQTGLMTGQYTLTCVGDATPTPAWATYLSGAGAVPTTCANGIASVRSDAAPTVALIDPTYRTPRSWRGNLSYTSSAWHMSYTLDALYSLNLDQPGRVDLNFTNTARFVTSDEGRPVFVGAGDIVSASGTVAQAAARRTTSFGHVFDNVSSNRSVSRAVTLTLAPDLEDLNAWFVTGSYTRSSTRARITGFDGATFGSPAARAWARGDFDARHQFQVQGGVTGHHLTFTLFGRVQSGLPFTPIIGSDVNGDGLVNDRAFAFDPATADPAVASGLASLLRTAQPNVRDCLTRQIGHAAGRNSCEGPWTAMLNAQVMYMGKLPGARWGSVALFVANPLGGLDQLAHGADHLRGWGAFAVPDPVLYSVRGFDPGTNRFVYAVNSRFGDTRPRATTLRAPFRVTLDIMVKLDPEPYQHLVNRWIRPGRRGFPGPRVSADIIKRNYSLILGDPYRAILEESDSLMLTRPQVDGLQSAQRAYRAARDSVLGDFASYLTGLDDDYDIKAVVRRQIDVMSAVTEIGHVSVRRVLPTLLDRFQLRMLPYPANRLLAAPDDVHGSDALSPR